MDRLIGKMAGSGRMDVVLTSAIYSVPVQAPERSWAPGPARVQYFDSWGRTLCPNFFEQPVLNMSKTYGCLYC